MKYSPKQITDDWYVSKLNFLEEVTNQYSFADDIILADCTLRDGEQQPGIVFNKEDKISIAKQLNKLGVHEIEVGMPAVSEEDKKSTEIISSLGLKSKITALARATKEDIDLVYNLGVDNVIISLPIGDLQRKFKLKWDDEKYFYTLFKMAEYAKGKVMHVNISPYDTTRVNSDFLDKFLEKVKNSEFIDRVRMVDTVGAASPAAIKYLTKKMKKNLNDKHLEVHCHDDFGLAVANTLSAVEMGANVISSTMNGLGERAGNAATEEIVMALKLLYGVDIGINTELLKETSELVEKLSGVKLQPNKGVVGKNSFGHESGMVVSGLINNSFTSEPYVPKIVGQKRKVFIGKKSGKNALKYKLDQLGYNPDNISLDELLTETKRYAIENKKYLSDEELEKIVEKHIN